MKKTCKVLIFILFSLLLISCKRTDLSVSEVLAQPYIRTNGEMGLSLYLRTALKTTDNSMLRVTDPSGELSWTISLQEVEYSGVKYYGTSNIAMPKGSVLPIGEWHVDLVYKDGRTISEYFNVSYKNQDTVLEKYPKISSATYDAESNLTIIK